ncbi:Pkinase-domain-containing protein [Hymenopellis radicata]|nr:Pkinase-domain-containing protein [Hymenopellis radicata]
MTDEPISPQAASKLGEYTVIRDIADGTFGQVKMAIHTITGQRVAMKYIQKKAINREKNKTRVRREFEYMRALRHPHIIKLYEVISTTDYIIFVLEYAPGELFNHIVAHGRMSEDKARRFFQQLISGVEYSHRLKIVHRDLKPENVLLDEDLNVKIGDFGLSSVISDGDFLTTSCGSPNYAAPEVIRGGIYAGPEIDVWSSGVILYVMLCGRLPFEDDNVHVLFNKITHGQYQIPSFLSPDAKSLIEVMLAVDPVKRITVHDITRHPFFTTGLPRYLSPLPPPPGPVLGTLTSLVTPPIRPVDFQVIEGFGRVEDDILDGLVKRLEGVTKEDILECLKRDDGPQGNTVKVAYLLLKDKEHTGKGLVEFAEEERDAQEAALDPRNALSPHALSPAGGDLKENPFEAEFDETLDEEEDFSSDEQDQDEEDEKTMNASSSANFAVLNSSLPTDNTSPHHLTSYASAKQSAGKERKHHKTQWHFGIRSRSPPMEIMLEIYKTLKQLGMEWKEKGNLGGLAGVRVRPGVDGTIERVKDVDGDGLLDVKAATSIYAVETRARVNNVVVLMNLQLYTVDSTNFLVDFHHKKTYKASQEPGAGRFDVDNSTTSMSSESMRVEGGFREEDVISPYVFMDVASNLILALARGGD